MWSDPAGTDRPLALRDNAFQVAFACKFEKGFAVLFDVVTVQETFTAFRHDSTKPKFAVSQRQTSSVISISKSAHLVLIIGPRMLVPQDVECVRDWLNAAEQQISELRLSTRVQADNFAIQRAAAGPSGREPILRRDGETILSACASLNTDCPRCGHSITPAERTHVDTEHIECPQCHERFAPGGEKSISTS